MIKRRAKATIRSGMNGHEKWQDDRLQEKMKYYSDSNKLSLF
jgi:hypothetical protein